MIRMNTKHNLQTSKCLRPDCERSATVRGLCNPCYGAATRAVKLKQTTWKHLESAGKVKPAQEGRGPGKVSCWFSDTSTKAA